MLAAVCGTPCLFRPIHRWLQRTAAFIIVPQRPRIFSLGPERSLALVNSVAILWWTNFGYFWASSNSKGCYCPSQTSCPFHLGNQCSCTWSTPHAPFCLHYSILWIIFLSNNQSNLVTVHQIRSFLIAMPKHLIKCCLFLEGPSASYYMQTWIYLLPTYCPFLYLVVCSVTALRANTHCYLTC